MNAVVDGDRLLIPRALPAALGWEWKPEGCAATTCACRFEIAPG